MLRNTPSYHAAGKRARSHIVELGARDPTPGDPAERPDTRPDRLTLSIQRLTPLGRPWREDRHRTTASASTAPTMTTSSTASTPSAANPSSPCPARLGVSSRRVVRSSTDGGRRPRPPRATCRREDTRRGLRAPTVRAAQRPGPRQLTIPPDRVDADRCLSICAHPQTAARYAPATSLGRESTLTNQPVQNTAEGQTQTPVASTLQITPVHLPRTRVDHPARAAAHRPRRHRSRRGVISPLAPTRPPVTPATARLNDDEQRLAALWEDDLDGGNASARRTTTRPRRSFPPRAKPACAHARRSPPRALLRGPSRPHMRRGPMPRQLAGAAVCGLAAAVVMFATHGTPAGGPHEPTPGPRPRAARATAAPTAPAPPNHTGTTRRHDHTPAVRRRQNRDAQTSSDIPRPSGRAATAAIATPDRTAV